jgi:hypothetical protein
MGGTHWVTMGMSSNTHYMHLIENDDGISNES